MRIMLLRSAFAIGLSVIFCGPAGNAQQAQDAAEPPKVKLLLLTGGEIHDHKAIGNVIQEYLVADGRYDVTRIENDLSALEAPRLAAFDVLVFYWTLGELSDSQRNGLFNWLREGHAFVTFHSGGDSFRNDPAYRDLVGGYFITHPHYRTFQVSIKDREHPLTKGLDEFMITDEQYVLSYDSRVHVLATGLHQGELMPVMWVKSYGNGKVHYNALGHDEKAFRQPMMRELVLRGIAWAAGLKYVPLPDTPEGE